MPATPSTNKGVSTLFAFTPRQVLLTMKHTTHNGTKLLLHQSIARYLERSGFSKTLKKFRSEAQFEKDDLEVSPVDLEEMCLKYLEICGKDAKSNISDQNELAVPSKNNEDGKSKEKKKKKSKIVSESLANNAEGNQLDSVTTVAENEVKDDISTDAKVINGSKTEKKSKSKTKKKDKRDDQGDAIVQIGDPNGTILKEENIEESKKEMTLEEKKDSKKRKRPISEENGQQVEDINADDEIKCRKIENLTGDQLQKISREQSNGNLENDGEKYSVQRSQKKQQKGSVEQKPVKAAFQRVQVDKIQFADERLQDNSYWAKDGAENGYGAKAAEILEKVRGRDFRHEKTKKKRGTYRGGQIDLHSHSVKFDYSDDE
ncbi:hypothetical protein Fmac_013140 [Flemingia macrophylla]|uniref:LisH domain-containing protein n=1 Tax=Flemingia macrophylla TaxID=520843 RepID=A0ABD1MSD2_9FABA